MSVKIGYVVGVINTNSYIIYLKRFLAVMKTQQHRSPGLGQYLCIETSDFKKPFFTKRLSLDKDKDENRLFQ